MGKRLVMVLSVFSYVTVVDFELLSIDPFQIPILRLKPDLNRPVNVDLNITNIDVLGLHKFNIYDIG